MRGLLTGLGIAMVVVTGLAGCGRQNAEAGRSPRSSVASPVPRVWLPLDDFYRPPSDAPGAPGTLIRSQELNDRVLPAGSRAWRIMYSTTFPDGSPATAVATVLAPAALPPGPRPVVMWEHGTVGIQEKCMPSAVTSPFEGVPALDEVIQQGWVLVATDYAPNPQGVHPYIIGEGESRNGVDSVRAAKDMPELDLDNRTAIWGHSQGGHAALSTAIRGGDYAPELNLVGAAAFAPASNMEKIMALHVNDATGARLGPYLATAYSQYYSDVKFDEVVPPQVRGIARKMADLCQFDPKDIPALQEFTRQANGVPIIPDPAAGPLGRRLRENAPTGLISIPLLVAQGSADEVVYPEVNDTYVDEQCDKGQSLTYWKVFGRDHGGVVAPRSPLAAPLIDWTKDRFNGVPEAAGCIRTAIK